MGMTTVLLEQPVHRDNWEGLRDVSVVAMDKYKVAVAADESCRSLVDAQKIIDGNLAHVINIKLAKLGVLGGLEVIDAARKANVALMIGGMVETRIAMGFAGHLASGLGCFRFVSCDKKEGIHLVISQRNGCSYHKLKKYSHVPFHHARRIIH
jgi:L-alanine-DL-glutamate epimerase-like enolase superfamily enzyme